MKKIFKNSIFPTLLSVFAVVIVGTGCPPPIEYGEYDESAPEVTIISPTPEQEIEKGSQMSLEAKFVDESSITIAKAEVYDAEDSLVEDYTEWTSHSTLFNFFSHHRPKTVGRYRVDFIGSDALGYETVASVYFNCIDTSGPEITVIAPNENAEFYTDGGTDSPDFIVLNAEAVGGSAIVEGALNVYNSSNTVVFTSSQLYEVEDPNARSLNATFRTPTAGEYTVEFTFKDEEGNSSIVTRKIICVFSELPGETDG